MHKKEEKRLRGPASAELSNIPKRRGAEASVLFGRLLIAIWGRCRGESV